ncbi:metalloregulator ArsR/SmtB family transcription factor [Microbacterium sp. LRZ72]|uniref:metalloregulator ArsR/SmtB family transcription factor n=1 Tax=Microbacterium sp. LRZ72 TaxID=2942481 RepID=UPI0029A1A439|nr:metalloregulator ArsR/SmtB family transcription factor [Microbacterium sp. LRZ72]MDX2376870.1 metalloregulator ArsR/SmtB family transcription factor [Microbacterium sp. LRZ72]
MDVGMARSTRLLGDPTRLRILQLITSAPDGRVLVGRVAEVLGVSQPTVSHHMKVLAGEGIVTGRPEGRRVWYSLAPAHADRIRTLLEPAPVDTAPVDLERLTDDLTTRFAGVLSRESVARCVAESHDLLTGAGDHPHLASRTAAFAAARLAALLQERGARSGERPHVLFVCVQNAGRSQMAAAILRRLAGERVRVSTAGSAPVADVRPPIVAALDEIGVGVDGDFPKPLTDDMVRAADVVVTMGCGDACPVYPGRRYVDWDIADPVGEPIEQVRRIRDDLDGRVRLLLRELLGDRVSAR